MAKSNKGTTSNPTIEIIQGGLGDTLEKVISKTGADKLIQLFTDGKDCGCEERKKKLNDLFPQRVKARCLTQDEYIAWGKFKETRSIKPDEEQDRFVCDLFASVFNRQIWYPSHNESRKPILSMIDKIDVVYDTYSKEMNNQY